MSQFKPGDVCVWQNQVGEWAWLNGKETTVLSHYAPFWSILTDDLRFGYQTDTICNDGWVAYAQAGDLRLKKPPATGEQSILDLFMPTPQLEVV